MATKKAPWKKKNPAGPGEHKTLTPGQKAQAKRAAKKAGRPYPNLVDNMRAASKKKTATKKAAKKSAPKKTVRKKTAAKKVRKTPAKRAKQAS